MNNNHKKFVKNFIKFKTINFWLARKKKRKNDNDIQILGNRKYHHRKIEINFKGSFSVIFSLFDEIFRFYLTSDSDVGDNVSGRIIKLAFLPVTNISNRSSICQTCHQHKLSPKCLLTDSDVTDSHRLSFDSQFWSKTYYNIIIYTILFISVI